MKRLSARARWALRILGVILLVVVAAHLTLWWLITPSRQEIAEIERWAAGQACVEDLDLWVREYARYGGEVSFTFRDPAVFNLPMVGVMRVSIVPPCVTCG